MGSFSVTCSVSGLGISTGTPVRCLLLTESPYEHDHPRNPWIVRTPPIRAQYDDYGSIERIHPDDEPISQLWLRGLREDVVERGLGDNSVHDVPVAADLSFHEMLGAIRAGRLRVSRDMQGFWRSPRRGRGRDAADELGGDPSGDEAYPSFRQRVEALLESQLPGRVSRRKGEWTYVVDEPIPYLARVRFGTYAHGEALASALEIARAVVCGTPITGTIGDAAIAVPAARVPTGLTAVVAAGSGSYAEEAELLVLASPATNRGHVVGPQWRQGCGQEGDADRTLRVGLAMIREDVWQALVAYPHSDYRSNDRAHEPALSIDAPCAIVPCGAWGQEIWHGPDAHRAGIRATWEAVRDALRRRRAGLPQVDLDPASKARANSALDGLRARLREMRAREDARRAALPPEERAALDAECEASRLAWEAQERRKREHPFFGDFTIESRARGWDMPGAWLVYEHPAPGVIDVSHHFSMLLCDDLEAPPALLDATADLASVLRTLADVGVVLRPAQASGPQYPEWGKSLRFARTVARIAEEAPARDDEDPDDPEFAPILAPATLEEVAQVAARLAQARASAEPDPEQTVSE